MSAEQFKPETTFTNTMMPGYSSEVREMAELAGERSPDRFIRDILQSEWETFAKWMRGMAATELKKQAGVLRQRAEEKDAGAVELLTP